VGTVERPLLAVPAPIRVGIVVQGIAGTLQHPERVTLLCLGISSDFSDAEPIPTLRVRAAIAPTMTARARPVSLEEIGAPIHLP
jgi:hypothetical protein